MRTRIVLLLCTFLLANRLLVQAQETRPNTLSEREKSEGWKLLFNGTNFAGWHNFGQAEVRPGWEVKDGQLVCADPHNAGDIVTDDRYDWFELQLDYNISHAGNSGIMYHVTDQGRTVWATGPEFQLEDNEAAADPVRCGWLYGLYAPPVDSNTGKILDATKPVGQWNHVRLIISPQRCEHYLNGVKYFEYRLGSADFKERVARSKFARMPNFAKSDIGYIALQGDHGRVAFRNIKLRRLTGHADAANYHLEYHKSHRASFSEQWEYTFPNYVSKRWFIALRYQPATAWSREVACSAALFTSQGWRPFRLAAEDSAERRPMLIIDFPHEDPVLKHGFTIRTTLTSTIYDQRLVEGPPTTPIGQLTAAQSQPYLAATETFDFNETSVRKWITEHELWKKPDEPAPDFVKRVYRELRKTLPYSTEDGGRWICSQILKAGFGECARHAIVGTSILRANEIPARMACALWATDEQSQGAHCWGEFLWPGVGWVPYDTSANQQDRNTDRYFGSKKGELIAGISTRIG